MTTQYTPTLKLALPVTGELSGTWGDVVNDNITSMIEQAIAGLSTINTWTGNAHTLTTANGTTSESRCAMLVAATGTGGSALTGAGEIICPASAKLYVVQNTTAFAVTLKTSAGTGVAVAASNTAFLFCNGTNVNSCVTSLPISTGVSGLGTGVATALAVNANATGGFPTIDGTATLTNKRITARVNAQTTTTSPWAWNSDSYDQQSFSALANALTINADAGTPTDGQKAVFRFEDNGTARALTWTTGTAKSFRAIGIILPTTTVVGKTTYVGCIYNFFDSRWDAVAVAQEA